MTFRRLDVPIVGVSSTNFVILAAEPVRGRAPGEGGMTPIGSRRDIIRGLAAFNTGPEPESISEDEDILYGPGIRIELPPGQDPVTQMLLTLTEQDIGWQVLPRLVRHFHWRILDTASGRELVLGTPQD